MNPFDPSGSEIRVIECPCCDNRIRVTDRNLDLIVQESARRYRYGATMDIGSVPQDIDLTGPLTAEDIGRIVDTFRPAPRPRTTRRSNRRRRP